MKHFILPLALACAAMPAHAAEVGADLQNFAYPHPVRWFEARSQNNPIRMAYMDVAPTGRANGRTVVLLHGKNFCAATWGDTVAALATAGYRVIVPDQVGFCKSSKPGGYQYSFHVLATLTRDLLARAGVEKAAFVGHSTGGILAARYALLYPAGVEQLVLVNPLGLNDTLAEGVPYADLSALRGEEARTDRASIKAYQLANYYHGQWRPEYDRWVDMLAGQYTSAGGGMVREAQARLSDMIQTQPVATELPRLRVPTTLMIGMLDGTAFRASSAPADRRAQVRKVPQAAEDAAKRISGATLVRFADVGHSPQVEAPERFNVALVEALSARR